MIIFSNGDAFFYPLSETSKGFSPNSAKSLTQEPQTKKSTQKGTIALGRQIVRKYDTF